MQQPSVAILGVSGGFEGEDRSPRNRHYATLKMIEAPGAPKTNRTSDLPLRRGLLYPLSYRGAGPIVRERCRIMALRSGCIAASLPRGRIIDAGPRPGRPGHRRRRRRTRRPSFRGMGYTRARIARGRTAVGVAGRGPRADLAVGPHADPAVRPHRGDAGVANLGQVPAGQAAA